MKRRRKNGAKNVRARGKLKGEATKERDKESRVFLFLKKFSFLFPISLSHFFSALTAAATQHALSAMIE